MSVKIIIDSACDMKPAEAERRGLIFLPLKTRIDGVEYLDGVTISHEQFYEKLERCAELPTTSQLTPYDFSRAYQKALADGSEVLAITLSGKLSGTAQSAVSAAWEYPGRVWVVDSENASIGEQVLVEYAVRLREQRLSAAEIAAELERVRSRVCILGLVDTLKYLVKGGRLSKTAAVAGGVLHIKPVLSAVDGELKVLGKARGSRQSNNYLNQTIREKGGVDFTMPYMLAYSGTDDTLLREYVENSRAIWAPAVESLPVSTVGSTIGTHAGPGLVAVAFFVRQEQEQEEKTV